MGWKEPWNTTITLSNVVELRSTKTGRMTAGFVYFCLTDKKGGYT